MTAPAKIQPMRARDHSETVREILDGYAQATPAEREWAGALLDQGDVQG